MQQIISQILQILSDILLNYFESLRNNVITQIITALWLIIGGTWTERLNKLQGDIGILLTHPIYYDPKTYDHTKEKSPVLYPFDIFQDMREGLTWFADRVSDVSKPVWEKLDGGIVTEGFSEKVMLGITFAGFIYTDFIIGFAIAYEQNLITTIPPFFQFYGIAVAFATIGSAFAAGLIAYEILREASPIWHNRGIKAVGLVFTTILFLLAVITAIGINAGFIIANTNLDPVIVDYINLASAISLQILTRVNALLATLLLPFAGALAGTLFMTAFVLSLISNLIRILGTILIVSIDLIIRIVLVILAILIFLTFAAPERVVSIVVNFSTKKKDNG